MKRIGAVRLAVLLFFALFLIIAGVALIIHHNREFSEKENRVLRQTPELTFDSLTSGKFMTDAEDFVADQFFMRDGWISTKLFFDKILGKKESNGVYLGKDNYLIEPTAEPDEKFDKNLAAIKNFSNAHSDLNVVTAMIPNAVYILEEKLPAGAPVVDQGELISRIKETLGNGVKYVDTTDTLKEHSGEYIYYKSDHHWTSLGAEYAFKAIAPSIGVTAENAEYTIYPVATDFSGTMASTSGADYVKDQVDIYVPLPDSEYVVEYVGENKKSATVYNSQALENSNKYEVFLGGNHPLISIKTTVQNKKNLLIIRDSYANCFAQFLTPHFSSIYMVDARYYSDDLERLITDNGITDILIMYNINTFVEDNNLAGMLLDE